MSTLLADISFSVFDLSGMSDVHILKQQLMPIQLKFVEVMSLISDHLLLWQVRAFRPMAGSKEMMVTAFSHSNAVGKLPLHLPDVPKGVRFEFPRYSPVEANTALQYYHR